MLLRLVTAQGLVDASKETIVSLLKKSVSVIIVIGGAQECRLQEICDTEALLARPGTAELVLKPRKGFVKLALQTGSPLVPIYSFGKTMLV